MLLGCSGPGAVEAIAQSELIGLFGLGAALLLAVAVVAAARRWVALVGVVVHPGWWMSARGGDCGYLLRYTSVGVTVVFAALAAWVIFRARRARHAG